MAQSIPMVGIESTVNLLVGISFKTCEIVEAHLITSRSINILRKGLKWWKRPFVSGLKKCVILTIDRWKLIM